MGSRDHSIECETCGESYGGMNAESEEHECDPVASESIANWTPEFVHNMCADASGGCDDACCWWHVGRPALVTLAANLSIAAALTYAYKLGAGGTMCRPNEDVPWPHIWADGCGRAAPGWRSE